MSRTDVLIYKYMCVLLRRLLILLLTILHVGIISTSEVRRLKGSIQLTTCTFYFCIFLLAMFGLNLVGTSEINSFWNFKETSRRKNHFIFSVAIEWQSCMFCALHVHILICIVFLSDHITIPFLFFVRISIQHLVFTYNTATSCSSELALLQLRRIDAEKLETCLKNAVLSLIS